MMPACLSSFSLPGLAVFLSHFQRSAVTLQSTPLLLWFLLLLLLLLLVLWQYCPCQY
jgi:hypothetical protein